MTTDDWRQRRRWNCCLLFQLKFSLESKWTKIIIEIMDGESSERIVPPVNTDECFCWALCVLCCLSRGKIAQNLQHNSFSRVVCTILLPPFISSQHHSHPAAVISLHCQFLASETIYFTFIIMTMLLYERRNIVQRSLLANKLILRRRKKKWNTKIISIVVHLNFFHPFATMVPWISLKFSPQLFSTFWHLVFWH